MTGKAERTPDTQVLIVSLGVWTRIAKFCKYLPKFGWTAHVLVAERPGEQFEFEHAEGSRPANLYRSGWFDWLSPCRSAYSCVRQLESRVGRTLSHIPPLRKLGNSNSKRITEILRQPFVSDFRISGTRLPDAFMGWIPYGVRLGENIIRQNPGIQIIYASAAPISSLFIGSLLSKRTSIPWVAELTDAWSLNHLTPRPSWVQKLEERVEKGTLRSASAIVTVSRPLADQMAWLHGRDIEVIPNGYDEDDYSQLVQPLEEFTITYTGTINPSRLPSAKVFLQALAHLRAEGALPSVVNVRFFGRSLETIATLACRYGVQDIVRVYGPVPFHECVRLQMESTVLLLLESFSSEAKVMQTLKLSEYLGARRPILAFAPSGGTIESVLKETNAGVMVTESSEAVEVLRHCLAAFQAGGSCMGLQANAEEIEKYSRMRQTEQLAKLLQQVSIRNGGGRSTRLVTSLSRNSEGSYED